MIGLALVLFGLGIFLSAFFSGSETGLYRASRVRLVIDALGGDKISRGILWLINNPALFVATTLIGNNLANYLCSLAIVLGISTMFTGEMASVAELVAPVVLSPLIFVYGELMPKNLFYYAPNKLLRIGGPLFLFFFILFIPAATLLWLLGRVLQFLVGEAPDQVHLRLAREELTDVLEEGHEAGILLPSQRRLAHNLFAYAGKRVTDFALPIARVGAIREGTRRAEVLRLARRHKVSVVPVQRENKRELIGYVRVVDVYLDKSPTISLSLVRPLLRIGHKEVFAAAMIKLQSAKENVAQIVDENGSPVGLLYERSLSDPMFRSN